LSKWDYLHFLIYFILFSGTLRFLFTSWDHKLEVAKVLISNDSLSESQRIQDFLPSFINNAIRPFHLLLYVILNWILIFNFKANLKERYLYTYQSKLMRNWLFCFNILLTTNAILFSILIFNLFVFSNNEKFLNQSYYFFFLLAVGYSALNIVLLAFPQILYGLPFESLHRTPLINTLPTMEPINDVVLEGKLKADDTKVAEKISPQFYSQAYISQIEDLLQIAKNEMWLLQPNFLLEDLTKNSNIPTHHLSYYFNNIAQLKFAYWRNQFRVNHAIELLKKGRLDSVNFKWIASNSGFSSSTTFFRVFKIHTTYTPNEYLLIINDCKTP
jgi:AraC-like DNA-binding protein